MCVCACTHLSLSLSPYYTCAYTHIHIYTYIHIYIYTHTCIQTYTHVGVCVCVQTPLRHGLTLVSNCSRSPKCRLLSFGDKFNMPNKSSGAGHPLRRQLPEGWKTKWPWVKIQSPYPQGLHQPIQPPKIDSKTVRALDMQLGFWAQGLHVKGSLHLLHLFIRKAVAGSQGAGPGHRTSDFGFAAVPGCMCYIHVYMYTYIYIYIS